MRTFATEGDQWFTQGLCNKWIKILNTSNTQFWKWAYNLCSWWRAKISLTDLPLLVPKYHQVQLFPRLNSFTLEEINANSACIYVFTFLSIFLNPSQKQCAKLGASIQEILSTIELFSFHAFIWFIAKRKYSHNPNLIFNM